MFYKDRFREARKKEGLSQDRLARALGKSRITIIQWEKGVHIPYESDIRMAAQRLNISVSEISDLKENVIINTSTCFEINESMEKFKHLSIEDRTKIENELLQASKSKSNYDAIKAKMERFETALDTVQSFIYTKNKKFEFTYINRDFREFLRKEKGQVLGKRNFDVFQAGTTYELDRLEAKILDGQKITNARIPMPGDQTQKAAFSGCPIYDKLKIIGLTASIDNITTQTKASHNYEILETAVDASNNILWIKKDNIKGELIHISKFVETLTCLPKKAFIDNPTLWLNQLVHPEDKEIVANYYQNQDYTLPIEYRIILEDKQIKYVSERCYCLLKNNKHYLFGVISDITTQKEADEAKELLEYAFNRSNVGISLYDPIADKCVYTNKVVSKIWGTTKAQMMQPGIQEHYIDTIIHPEIRGTCMELFKDIQNIPSKRVDKILHKQKGVRYIDVSRAMLSYKGKTTILNIIKDITEKHLQEIEKEYLYSALNNIDSLFWVLGSLDAKTKKYKYHTLTDGINKIFGCSKRTFLESRDYWEKSIHPKHKKMIDINLYEIPEEKFPINIEYKIVINNKEKWIKERVHKKDSLVFGLCTDITKYKRKSDKLTIEYSA